MTAGQREARVARLAVKRFQLAARPIEALPQLKELFLNKR